MELQDHSGRGLTARAVARIVRNSIRQVGSCRERFPKRTNRRSWNSAGRALWVEQQLFRADVNAPGPVFSIVIPPPNVTGSLHIGHMLEHTEIDILTRWRRMTGYNTLYLPGTDHASISTNRVVVRQLQAQGIDYRALGREKFLERAWQWKEEAGGTITRQMMRIGESCDWSRERFTLSPELSRVVTEVFVRLYEDGLIYRAHYIVNWCPQCLTALSDLEVVHQERQGHLWHIRYPLADGSGHIVVATTRPETMLGDTAVAVHPDDDRYRAWIGKAVRLPLMNREIPIIADPAVDREFGTGAVKITPAHDPNDFEMGRRHNLPEIDVMTDDAKMSAAAGGYAGMDRYDARKKIVVDLDAQGLLERVEQHTHAVGVCDRCGTVVEPRASTQWWLKMKPLAEPAIAAVERGEVEIHSRPMAQSLFRVDAQHSRLVHLAANLVGPSNPGLALRQLQRNYRGANGAREMPALRDGCAGAGSGHARDLVQFGAMAFFDDGLAGRKPPTTKSITPRAC